MSNCRATVSCIFFLPLFYKLCFSCAKRQNFFSIIVIVKLSNRDKLCSRHELQLFMVLAIAK